jgi:hypothetical protein
MRYVIRFNLLSIPGLCLGGKTKRRYWLQSRCVWQGRGEVAEPVRAGLDRPPSRAPSSRATSAAPSPTRPLTHDGKCFSLQRYSGDLEFPSRCSHSLCSYSSHRNGPCIGKRMLHSRGERRPAFNKSALLSAVLADGISRRASAMSSNVRSTCCRIRRRQMSYTQSTFVWLLPEG